MTDPDLRLAGRAFLIVEDQYLIARELGRFLERLGGRVVGLASNVESALDSLSRERPDVALLDIDLDGERSYAVATTLQDAGIPFVFTTGYDRTSVDPRFHAVPHLEKPIAEPELAALLARIAAP